MCESQAHPEDRGHALAGFPRRYTGGRHIVVGMTERPMQEPSFLILTALASGPQHGYGMILDIERISGGRVRLRAGTLYAALDRLSAEGLVAPGAEEIVEGRNRRYYKLTEDGAARLAAEAKRMQLLAASAAKRLAATARTARKTRPSVSPA
jgi:DNA-binding PadR family transcriptional regulator